jgi:hypothetical protein
MGPDPQHWFKFSTAGHRYNLFLTAAKNGGKELGGKHLYVISWFIYL